MLYDGFAPVESNPRGAGARSRTTEYMAGRFCIYVILRVCRRIFEFS